MKRLAVYVEGGGNTAQLKAELRVGFEALFGGHRQAIRAKGGRLDFIPCGGRQKTYERFVHEHSQTGQLAVVILLVDAEEAIQPEIKGKPVANAEKRKNHLIKRDGWDLKGVQAERLHLMVQCMEAWIVADPQALEHYYGQGFHRGSLPARSNLEDEQKPHVYSKLTRATRNTSKGEYAKIKHASKLLALIDSDKIAKRCPRFVTFSNWLDEQIEGA